MGQSGVGHVMPALPDSGPAVKPAKPQPPGERYAESEVLGLSIALDMVDEICRHGVVVESEGDSDVVPGGSASGEVGDGGGERLLRGQRRQERRVYVWIGRMSFF